MISQAPSIHFSLFSLIVLLSIILQIIFIKGFILTQLGFSRTKNQTIVWTKSLGMMALCFLTYLLIGSNFVYMVSPSNSLFLPELTAWWTFPTAQQTELGQDVSVLLMILYRALTSMIVMLIVSAMTLETMKIWGLVLFGFLMMVLIFPIQCYWLWGNGILHTIGFLDHTGLGLHILSGLTAGIICLLFIGPRRRQGVVESDKRPIRASNISTICLGGFFMWLGGAALSLSMHTEYLTIIVVVKNLLVYSTATLSALFFALALVRFFYGIHDMTLVMNAFVAGIVATAILPHETGLPLSIAFGFVVTILSLLTNWLVERRRFDDGMGLIASFGVGAIFGLLAICLVLNYPQLAAQRNMSWGLFDQIWAQLVGISIIVVWTVIWSALVCWVIDLIFGLRVPPEAESVGLDVSSCGLPASPGFTRRG